jgi:hypothetical protein
MPQPPTQIDLKRLAAEVSMQHGIRIDPDDPMMAVVTLNRLVFEQAVAQVLDRVQSAVRDFETATEKVQVRAGGVLAQEVRECAATLRDEIVKVVGRVDSSISKSSASTNSASPVGRTVWFVAGLSLALVLFAFGVWLASISTRNNSVTKMARSGMRSGLRQIE